MTSCYRFYMPALFIAASFLFVLFLVLTCHYSGNTDVPAVMDAFPVNGSRNLNISDVGARVSESEVTLVSFVGILLMVSIFGLIALCIYLRHRRQLQAIDGEWKCA